MVARASLMVADWQRLNRLLEQALELDPGARPGWLDALAPEDGHLRPLLTDLLAQSDATGFADTADPPATVARIASEALAAMRREQAGDRIGPWRLDTLVAEGGMGAVWMAQRADGVMQRTAALKLPRAEWVDRGLAQRIALERSILARLQHPHIAVLYDAGLSAEGRPYLALEFVDGVPIDAYCKGRNLKTVLHLFVQVARAVAHAHAQLVIHRDLKPSNVLVTAEGVPKLLDFGISKLIEGEAPAAEASALTRLTGRPLTLAYAAPEHILGLPISVAADVYSLGVMLYELLAGVRPFRGSTPRELEAEVLRGDLKRPSEAATDKARGKALRGDLDAIVLTALKREPGERFQTAAALADDLARHLAGEPVSARPDSATYRLAKFALRHRLVAAASTAIVLALGAGFGAALWQANIAREQATRATALNTFVLSLIRQADPNATQQTKAADLAMLGAIEHRIDAAFQGSPDQLLQLRLTVGEAYLNRGENAAARRVFERAVDHAAPVMPEDDLQVLRARVRASDYNLVVSPRVSEELERAITLLRAKGAAGADLLIDALLIRHALNYTFGGPAYADPARHTETLKEAQAVATYRFGAGSRAHLRVLTALANVTDDVAPAEALQLLELGLEQARLRDDGSVSSVDFRDASTAYAATLCETGQRAAGANLLRDAIAAVRADHGETSVQMENLVAALARCSVTGRDPAFGILAIAAYEIAAARERPPSTNLMRRAQEAFGAAMYPRDFTAAERFYQAAIANSEAIADPVLRERLVRWISINRVCQLAYRGDIDEAERFAAPLLEAANQDFARHGRMTYAQAPLFDCLTFVYRHQGRHQEAVQMAQVLIDRCRASALPPRSCEGRGLITRAQAELTSGRPRDALATIEERRKIRAEFRDDGRLAFAYGRALLADGRARESIEPIGISYALQMEVSATSPYTIESLYWLGRAYIDAGEVERGKRLVEMARPALAASPLPGHRRLAATP